jgi:hypothetical protein
MILSTLYRDKLWSFVSFCTFHCIYMLLVCMLMYNMHVTYVCHRIHLLITCMMLIVFYPECSVQMGRLQVEYLVWLVVCKLEIRAAHRWHISDIICLLFSV